MVHLYVTMPSDLAGSENEKYKYGYIGIKTWNKINFQSGWYKFSFILLVMFSEGFF